MTTEERTSNRPAGTDEHLDAAQDENSGEEAPSPEQRNQPAPDSGEEARKTGSGAMGEADRPAGGRG